MRNVTRLVLIPIVLLAIVLMISPALAAKTTSSTNKAKLGTKQLSGENAQIGTTYTLGKTHPINITLNKVEYSIEPVVFGDNAMPLEKDQKFMVLHYTLHNPLKNDWGLSWHTVEIFAVDKNDKNWRFACNTAIEATGEQCNMSLKPGQKTKIYTCIKVPAEGEIPKLVIQSGDKLVLRYDLRGKVAPLPEGIADPNDESGATAPETVKAVIGKMYPIRSLHAQIDSIQFSTSPIGGKSPKKGGRYLVVLGTATYKSPGKHGFVWSTLKPSLKDADGGSIRWNGNAYFASRDENINTQLQKGDQVKFRYYFEVPENLKLQSLTLTQGGNGREFFYDLSELQ